MSVIINRGLSGIMQSQQSMQRIAADIVRTPLAADDPQSVSAGNATLQQSGGLAGGSAQEQESLQSLRSDSRGSSGSNLVQNVINPEQSAQPLQGVTPEQSQVAMTNALSGNAAPSGVTDSLSADGAGEPAQDLAQNLIALREQTQLFTASASVVKVGQGVVGSLIDDYS